jgi:hypothetical protein
MPGAASSSPLTRMLLSVLITDPNAGGLGLGSNQTGTGFVVESIELTPMRK